MSYNNILDKQSHKLASRSGNNTRINISSVTPLDNSVRIENLEQFRNTANDFKKMGYGLELLYSITNPDIIPDIYKSELASEAYNANFGGIKSSYSSLENYQKYLNDKDKLNLATRAQNDYRGMQITNGVFNGISSLTNMGLGIWNAWEQSQLAKSQRDLAAEQIAASQEARKQRDDEIKRLKRVRSNTNQRFNSNAIVSRSY